MLALLVPRSAPNRPLHLLTDAHPGYRSAVARYRPRHHVRHHVFPNPPRRRKGIPRSPQARRRDAALFPVDVLHALLRHSLAHHRRETIAFGRRLNAVLERGFLTMVWRNFIKARSERRPTEGTPAMYLGATPVPWSWRQVLARRLFPQQLRVPAEWLRIYRRELTTPDVGRNTRHACVNAY
jgi:hypothetical protein